MFTTKLLVSAVLCLGVLAGCGADPEAEARKWCFRYWSDYPGPKPSINATQAWEEWQKECRVEVQVGLDRDKLKPKHPECWARARREVPSTEADAFFDKCVAGKV